MAWYYVKNGGTATGDGGRVTTQRTGSWSGTASEYYNSIQASILATTVPTDGDFILISDTHNATISGVTALNGTGSATGAGLSVISVDDTNQENYKPGALETNSANGFSFDNNGLIAGVAHTSTSVGVVNVVASAGARHWRFIDSDFVAFLGAVVSTSGDGTSLVFINCTLTGSNTALSNGAKFSWEGGAWASATSMVTNVTGIDGGATMYLEGVDLSSLSSNIWQIAWAATTTDVTSLEFVQCQLSSIVGLPSDSFLTLPNHRFIMRACDDSTGGNQFRFHYQTGTGKAVNNESVYVTADKAWGDTSDKSSVEVTTKSNCSHILPFIFDLPLAQTYIDLADTAEDVLRIPITTTLTLTDTEIAAFLMYPDGTTSVQPNWVTSGKTVGTGNYGTDPLAAGTTLTTSSTAWTGAKTNKYHLELDTTGDVGQAQAVGVRIEVYRASIAANTLMLATEFEVS